eukprot:623745-Pleurochrysis_carterae.AAC.1
MESFVRYDENNKAHFMFDTASRPTCKEFTRVAYGIPTITWNQKLALLREGQGALRTHQTVKSWKAAARAAQAAEE